MLEIHWRKQNKKRVMIMDALMNTDELLWVDAINSNLPEISQ